MDLEYSESIEFNCQFFAITVWKEGRNKAKDERNENWLVFLHLQVPVGVLLEIPALLKTTEQAWVFGPDSE